MGMLIHRHNETGNKSKTTKLADITPVEKKSKKSEEKKSEDIKKSEK